MTLPTSSVRYVVLTLCAAALTLPAWFPIQSAGQAPAAEPPSALAAAPDKAPPAGAPASPPDPLVLQEPPLYGVYFEKIEPSFYTGFAPRCQEPRRIHLHVGRGNQLRLTTVLSDEAIQAYARDLYHRYRVYRRLIDEGKLVLTQNRGFEAFEETIRRHGLERLVGEEAGLPDREVRTRNLALLRDLNPGRVFEIRMPVETVISRWVAGLTAEDLKPLKRRRRLELAGLMLPTRLFTATLNSGQAGKLDALIQAAAGDPTGGPRPIEGLRPLYLDLLDDLSGGIYPVEGEDFHFYEFTAIYPIGTLNEFTNYKGKQIPLYPCPGRRALTTHQRTKTVDHIPTKISYGYFPWIPYMHVGKTMHNSFHTLWWRVTVSRNPFLPASWKAVSEGSRSGKKFPLLWLLSRGPMSHGCTHVNGGHILELRQIFPSETERLYQIDNYRNKSYHYDVFDIDGDFKPEVIGVKYYIAYSLKNLKPFKLRVANERQAYYDWLYAGELRFRDDGQGWFEAVTDGRFVDRTAEAGRAYADIELYEAAYEPEKLQFYRLVDIPFARELRKVSVTYPRGFQPGD